MSGAMRSKLFLPILLALLVVALFAALIVFKRTRAVWQPQKHLLLITLDTTRADRLGCYGYDKPTSPNLDALARDGIVFDLAIAQAAVTPVSHASILTGLDPYHHGLRVMHGLVENSLPAEHQTLAEIWQDGGGATAAFVSAYPVTADFGLDRGFDFFEDQFPLSNGEGLKTEKGTVNTGRSQRRAHATTDAALEWLDKEADLEQALFMWVHYFDPHDPHVPPPREFMMRFKPEVRDEVLALQAIYDADICFMDFHMGRLIEAFKERGVWDDTIVVVVADHGEGLGDHGWWSHGILYQEQIRVPLVVRVPGGKQGLRVPSLVRTIDLMPTILDLAGAPQRRLPAMDGASLVEALQTGKTKEGRIAYADSVNILTYVRPDSKTLKDKKNDKLYCLMNASHKLIYHQLNPDDTEFYDLAADPAEQNNLAAQKPPEMVEMMQRLEAMDPFSEILPGMTPTDLERIRKLRELGYNQ
jgi:arylsulfatase A-like enzyme